MGNNIGESVLLSYFKYTLKCLIYCQNWTNSKEYTEKANVKEIYDNLYVKHQEVRNNFTTKSKNSKPQMRSLESILNETEIDAIGFKGKEVYIADVAFHSNGLGYGDNEDRIFKKLFRFCLIALQYFFDYEKFEIMFTCPFVKPSEVESVNKVADKIQKLFEKYFSGKSLLVKCVINDDFSNTILKPLLEIDNKITDEDYFLRALQLIKTCGLDGKTN